MNRYGIITLLVLATLSAGPARADILLKIPGIPGTSTLEGHENEIVLNSLQFGGGQVVPRSGPKPCAGPSSKTELSEFTLTKQTDKSSPKLVSAIAAGTVFPQVTLTIGSLPGGAGFQETDRYVLSDAFLTGYSVSSGGFVPSESLSVRFQSVQFVHTDPSDGEESVTWSVCG